MLWDHILRKGHIEVQNLASKQLLSPFQRRDPKEARKTSFSFEVPLRQHVLQILAAHIDRLKVLREK